MRGKEYLEENAADAICDIALVSRGGKTLVKISQYVSGPTGSHADLLGYFVSTLSWDGAGAWSAAGMSFVLSPQ